MRLERRAFTLDELRVADAASGKGRSIQGHAALFNVLSLDIGGFREQIAPGAFAKSLEQDDIRALFNHDANYVLGRNTAKTLRLAEDQRGLAIENDPPDTQWARDLLVSLERGDVNQMSFGFIALRDRWELVNDEHIRTLLEVQLFDVSPVTFPAYPATEVSARSLQEVAAEGVKALAAARATPGVVQIEMRRRRLRLAELTFAHGA